MEAIGVVSLVLTVLMMIFYAYVHRHTESDVSFFLSVGLISVVMNLCTNMNPDLWGLSVMYIVIDVAFLALGLLFGVKTFTGFFTSIGPWFKRTFSNLDIIGWQILSLLLFPVGAVLYFVWYRSEDRGELAAECGRACMWGLLLWGIAVWLVLGLAL